MKSTSSKSKPIGFEKKYNKIVKKANKINKAINCPSPYLNINENFKKFSLYSDSPNSVTSFDTNASLQLT